MHSLSSLNDDTTYLRRLFNMLKFKISDECRGKFLSILAERKETKFTNARQVFRLDMDLVKNATSSIGYEHSA